MENVGNSSMKKNLKQLLQTEIFFLDGAMGTMLEGGLKAGQVPEILNVTNSKLIREVHEKYFSAGSQIITANTFGANALKLQNSGYSVSKVIECAVLNAKEAGAQYVALDVGPLGQLLTPSGTLGFEEAVALFKETILAGTNAGADCILIETMSDLYEVKAAVVAAKECCDLPILVSLSFEENGRTFMGCDGETAIHFCNAIGVDAVGVNCSRDPFIILPVLEVLCKYSKVPVFAMPNAGLPKQGSDGKTVYGVSVKEFGLAAKQYYKLGVSGFGGCCGTTPEYIKEVKKVLDGKTKRKRKVTQVTAVTSCIKTTMLGENFIIFGERLNPTGKPLLKEALKNQDMDFVLSEAIDQENNGAEVLDVNCGLVAIDEEVVLTKAVQAIQSVVSVPLQIDSTNYKAMESACRIYNGKPILNSANGKKESMEKVFTIAKKYGAAVLGLTLDENGIPKTAKGRFDIAKKIVDTAKKFGIDKSDIIIDCLTLTASAQQEQVKETLQAIKMVKEKLGVKTILGVSNVSFGLPNRAHLNSVFLTMARAMGLDSAILDPKQPEMQSAIAAFSILDNSDKGGSDYIAFCEKNTFTQSLKVNQIAQDKKEDFSSNSILTFVCGGQKEAAVKAVKEKLATAAPFTIIDNELIPALNQTGKLYETGKLFLPQLLGVAEAAKACFEVVNERLDTKSDDSKDKIVLATVKGDIHDIGKNIVKVLLQSHGFSVVDLGKDVDPLEVVRAAKEHKTKLVGLSALMTTTIPAMKETISLLKAECPDIKVVVGGAVLSEEYKAFVGADYYAVDAMAGITIAKDVVN